MKDWKDQDLLGSKVRDLEHFEQPAHQRPRTEPSKIGWSLGWQR